MNVLKDKVILLTGGTGSFGNKFTEIICKRYKPKKVIIFSRDEFKQSEMKKCFSFHRFVIQHNTILHIPALFNLFHRDKDCNGIL